MSLTALQRSKRMNTEQIVIIGSGPAGFTAALYAARSQLNPLLFEGTMPGGQLMGTSYIENWPGTTSILGPKLMTNMREHAQHFGGRIMRETIDHVDFSTHPFTLKASKLGIIVSQAVIVATGATPKRIGCPGESDYWGRGVSTCAVCDGAFYKDKKVLIIGGGDSAMEEASFMTRFTSDITVIHILPQFTASPLMQERVLNNHSIKVIYESTVSKIIGDGNHVTSATIVHQKTGACQPLPCDAIFIAIGLQPNTELFKGKIELDSRGYIVKKKNTETSVHGVFVAGDVADARYRQAITSAGTGCMAALDAEHFLKNLKPAHQ